MPRRPAVLAPLLALSLGPALAGCGSSDGERTGGGVPERWYAAIDDAVAEQPGVGSVALLENGGPCALRDEITVGGTEFSDVSDHGVVRLGGDVPAVTCSWYEETSVEVMVARADSDALWTAVVADSGATDEQGNEQTETEVEVDGRSYTVVRTEYPTNPAAGPRLVAHLLDEGARGRVSLTVSTERLGDGYDERSAAEDLAAFVAG